MIGSIQKFKPYFENETQFLKEEKSSEYAGYIYK